MATTYNTAFGSLPGYNEMLGTTNTTGGGQQQTYGQTTPPTTTRPPYQAAQTFAQMQRQGVARPAPPTAPQAQPFAQYGGSQQAQQMRQRLQSQLEQFGQAPSRFDTQSFQQIRGAQAANLQQEYRGQLQALNEEMARRGLSASSVGGGRMGDLAGQQARALATLDAQLLQQAAETQAQDRAQLLAASQGLAELASAQDLAQFEANRVAQAATFENQLRAAQFGQQQFEQAGQEAFQGAQAEEAARQAERQFGLQATGQAATLSMDLQRLLGQQEIERAGLTGQLGGMQTLAGRQFGEQQRQFDIQQALQAQLGLGGLSLEQQRFAEQARQFGVTSAEEQRQFNIQQALQQQLGLGGLGLQQAQFGLEQQRFVQQAQDNAAERQLREKLQTTELSAQERQQLTEIQARKDLQTQQIGEQARQFGLTLSDQQAARVYQGGFTTQELAIRRQQVDNELALQNRQLSETERNNLAIRGLQRDQFESEKDFRSQQLGLNRDELEQRADQIKEDQRLRGVEIENEQAYREAELDLRTTQISNEYTRAGQQIDLEKARIQAQKDISSADNAAQLARLEKQTASQERIASADRAVQQTQLNYQNAARLSEQSGIQHTVGADGQVVPLRDAQGNFVRTSAETQAAEARKLQSEELTLRRQLGLMEATGQGLTVDAEGRIVAGTGPTAQTLQARQIATQERQLAFQNAARLSEQSGVQYTVDDRGNVVPLRDAQGNAVRTSAETQAAEARKLQSEELTLRRQLGLMEATGQGLTVDAEGRLVPATGTGAQTLQARQLAFQNAARLSEQSGVQYTVKDDGTVDVLRDAQGNPVRTSAFTQADEARKQQQEQFNIAQFGKAGTIQTGTQTLAALQQALQQAGVTGKFDGQLTQEALQNAYARAAQLTQATGQQHTVDPNTGTITAGSSTLEARLREAGITGTFGGALTQEALQNAYARAAQLSQITGQQYTVNPATGALTPATGEAGRTFAAQLQAAGITGQFGGALTQEALQNAYQRAAQLSQITGKQYTVNPATGAITEGAADTLAARLQQAELTGTLGGQATLQRLQQNLQQAQIMSQITGQQFTVDASGNLVRGTADTEARRQFTLENLLRQTLGMSEATGYVYDPITGQRTTQETVQGQIARSQTLLSLANALGNLTPEQISQLLGRPSGTNPPVTTRAPGSTNPPITSNPPITGETTTSPPTTTQAPYSGWNPEVDMFGYVNQASLLQTPLKSIIESGTDLNSIIGTRYKVGGYYVFYDGSGWKAIPAAG